MSHATDKIRHARRAVEDVMFELFSPQIVEGAAHPRTIAIAADAPGRNLDAVRRIAIEQRTDAGLHLCLAVASAALEVSRALLDRAGDAQADDSGERALRRCAQDVGLVVDAARRAHAVLSDRLPIPCAPG